MTDIDDLDLRDARLRPAVDILRSGAVDLLSLDVFDTLLWRTVPDPVDVFELLGHRLSERSLVQDGVRPELFADLRRRAESRARHRHPNPAVPEVTLPEIYAFLPSAVWTKPGAAEEAAGIEVELERTTTLPDLEVLTLAVWAQRAAGCQIALVSDTYLSEAHLRHLLDRAPLQDLKPDFVLTSSCRGTNKGHALFAVLLKEAAIRPDRVLHIGDHPQSDVASPAALGMRSLHIPKFEDELASVVGREARLLQTTVHPESGVDAVHGDAGLTSLRAKVARQESGCSRAVAPYWTAGATIFGPVFTGFAHWLTTRAEQLGEHTVHAFMREGEFLARLVNSAAVDRGADVRALPLWLSRRACLEASVGDVTEEVLEQFASRRKMPTAHQLLESLGVPEGLVGQSFPSLTGRLDDRSFRADLFAAILANEEAKAAIARRAAVRRGLLADHVVRAHGSERGRMIVADLGWGGTIQHLLAQALRLAGLDIETYGLYLVTSSDASKRWLDGAASEGYLATGGLPEQVARWIIRSPEVLEQVCMHESGSLVGFGHDGTTLHAPYDEPPQQRLQRVAVQKGVLAFQAEHQRYGELLGRRVDGLHECRDLLRAILLRFVLEPTPYEARLFSSWVHDENLGDGGREHLISQELATVLRHLTPEALLSLPMDRVYWPFGLAALVDPALAEAASAVAARTTPGEAFEPSEHGEIAIHLSSREVADRYLAHMPAPANHNGLRFARLKWGEPTAQIRLHFTTGPGLVRLDHIRAIGSIRGLDEPATIQLSTSDEMASVQVVEGTAVTANVIQTDGPGPVLAVQWPVPHNGQEAYEVEFEIGFATLPLPVAATRRGKRGRILRRARGSQQ